MHTHTAELPVITGAPRLGRRRDASFVSVLGVALLVASSCITMVWRTASPPTPPVVDATPALVVASLGDRPTHGGRYRAEVVSVSSLEVGAAQQWIVKVERRNHRRLNGARIAARAWMPDDPMQPAVPAVVSPLGGGRYRLDGIRLARAGWWNIALVLDGGHGVDSVAFNVVLR